MFGSHWIVAAGAYVGERALAGAPGTGCVSRRHARLKAAVAQWPNSETIWAVGFRDEGPQNVALD